MTDSVYRERAHLVAHLATVYPSTIGLTDPSEQEWHVITIDLPTGQATWHVSPDDMDLFGGVKRSEVARWDGHSTEEKYARLRAVTRIRSRRACEECFVQTDATGAICINEPCEEHA